MARLIVCANRKGGVGKTVVAVNVAAVLAREAPAVLVDADPQASASGWIESSPALVIVKAPDPDALRRVLVAAKPRERAGFVVVDCPPFDPETTAAAVELADLVLVPLNPSPVSIRAAVPLLESLGKRSALVVLNAVKPSTTTPQLTREALKAFGVPVARTEIGHRIAHAHAEAARQAVVDFAPHSLAAAEILALVREIRRALKG